MDFIAKLTKYIAELKVIGGKDEFELADNLKKKTVSKNILIMIKHLILSNKMKARKKEK